MLKKPYTNMNTGLWNKNKKWFWKILFLRIEIFMNKPVYLGISVLEFSKISKTKLWWKAKLCCMDTDSFIVYIKTYDFYKDIAVSKLDLITQIMN